MAGVASLPALEPIVARPVSLIPVGLKEAALDSVSFRAACMHLGGQADALEKWLDNYTKAISRLTGEISVFESQVTGFLQAAAPPTNLSEAIIDHDYSLLAAKRFGEGSQSFWGSTLSAMRKLESGVAEPMRAFLQTDLRPFKKLREVQIEAQQKYDNLNARYFAQKKTAEASSLREDAFQLHESRKAYLKASMDLAVAAPQLRMALDKMLVKVFSEQAKGAALTRASAFASSTTEFERIRGWSREMEIGEKAFKRKLLASRRHIEDQAEAEIRPSRELEDYNAANAPKIPAGVMSGQAGSTKPERQNWLNVKTLTSSSRPTRTMWLRRWFFIKNGIFGWLIQDPQSGAVLESERIGILLLGVRVATQEERRFCFELKTKDRTIVLQAANQAEMNEWIATINVAKQKALEDPGSTDASTGNSQALDPAFAISAPVAPEFSAVGAELHTEETNEKVPTNTGLSVPNPDGLVPRQSFDVTSTRRASGMEEKDGHSGRERAERIIAKLKSEKSSSSQASGGIASMISAAHGSMPLGMGIGPAVVAPSPVMDSPVVRSERSHSKAAAALASLGAMPRNTLAPSTLVVSPNPTDLSDIAVMVNGEQTLSTGRVGGSTGLPSGMLANVWGSSSWGFASRVERGEVREGSTPHLDTVKDHQPGLEKPETKSRVSPTATGQTSLHSRSKSASIPSHTRNSSLDDNVKDLKRAILRTTEYPLNYPPQLKAQDAQFKLLFPNVKPEEKAVLVFRASWSAGSGGDQREFPGRVYVTEKGLYFYSNYVGFVLVTGFQLDNVLEITSAPGRDSDFIFLHLKHEKIDFSRVTIKTFIEPMRLLERRLNLLLENSRAENPDSLEDLLKALVDIEGDGRERSSSQESISRAQYDGHTGHVTTRSGRDIGAKINIDRSLGGPARYDPRDSLDIKFKLPSKPIVYVPRGMTEPIVAKEFEVSPKALFHVLFGDRSAVWQVLYHERQAQDIRQGPWLMGKDNTHLRRAFEYRINNIAVTDAQIIDVMNDHLCYVVTDRKFPWFLPFSRNYSLVTKIVITYLSKSRCRLAIYTTVEWTRRPWLSATRTLIEGSALRTIDPDARDLLDVAIDQVRRLGAHSHTKKAVQIFGSVGMLKTVTEYGEGSSAGLDLQYRPLKQRSLLQLFFRAWGRFVKRCTNDVLSILWDTSRAVLGALSTHWLLVLLLVLSVCGNLLHSAAETSIWWQDKRASKHLRQLGVGPDLLMNKAISLYDLPEAAVVEHHNKWNSNMSDVEQSICYQVFEEQALVDITEVNAGALTTSPAAVQLRRTRERLGMYRHDLLVAMRVVNRIEGEMIGAQWESWIRDETRRCTTVENLLNKRNETEVEGLAGIKQDLSGFCDSCRQVQQTMPSSSFI